MKRVVLSLICLLLMAPSFASGGNSLKVIEGHVVDDSGNPAIGAKVVLLGSDKEVYTDFEGAFKFESVNPSSQLKLKVNYIAHQELILEINTDKVKKISEVELLLESK